MARGNHILIPAYGALVKRLNTPPSQGGIHGFESRTRHHKDR